jgi:hypothetical protein
VGHLLIDLERALKETAKGRGLEIDREVVVSLIAISRAESNVLTLSVLDKAEEDARTISKAIASRDYHTIPRDAQKALHDMSQRIIKRNWIFTVDGGTSFAERAVISQDNQVPEPLPPALVEGTTIVYGQCIRAGGLNPPRADIRLDRGGAMLRIIVDRQMAKALAARLYEDVGIEGLATWETDHWTITKFVATGLTAYQETDPVEAFERLSDATRGRWDNVSALKHVDSLRSGETGNE